MTSLDPVTERPSKLRLDIDIHNLEKECANQPKQCEYFGRALADAQKRHDDIKAELAVLAAQIDRDAREDPAGFGIGKVTEGTIAAAVLLAPRHQTKVKELNEAKHAIAILNASVEALVDRKKSLAGIIELYGQEYFSIPSDSGSDMPSGVRRRRAETDNDG